MKVKDELTIETIRLGVIGCGTMGKCIMIALTESGVLNPEQIRGTVSQADKVMELKRLFPQSEFTTDNESVVEWANVILICLKPQMLEGFLMQDGIQQSVLGKLIISIAAGVKLTQYQEWLPKSYVVRAMPNTPCQIREGMVVLSAPADLPPFMHSIAVSLMSTLGRCRPLPDRHMDAVTALSGSGPAFASIILESLADGGVMMGLSRDVAIELAAQALQGTARMVLQNGLYPAQIKDAVTTPGGCTIAGILTMEDGRIRSVLARTIQEATIVASTLGSNKRN